MTHIADSRDVKIISCICDNARLPYSKIGKMTRISKDRVRERMKVMEKELFILSYFPLINYGLLGYKLFHVYLRFNRAPNEDGSFFARLKKNDHVVALTRVAGKWDVEIQILGKNRGEISSLLIDLGIKDYASRGMMILQARDMHLYSMRFENFKLNKEIMKSLKLIRYRADSIDLKILKALSLNAREKVTEIAAFCNVGEDVVRYRIKNLIKHKVILGFYARTNKHRFGLTSYILGLSLSRAPLLHELASLEKLKNVYYARSFSGKCNLVIGFSAKDNMELIGTIDFVKNCFGKNLAGLELLILLDRYKFVCFPFNIESL